MYFFAIAAASTVNLVGMIVWIVSPPEPNSSNGSFDTTQAIGEAGPIVDTIVSVCMSRFILDLLAIASDERGSQCRTSQWATIRFATAAGAFGADLSTLDVVLREEDALRGEGGADGVVRHIREEIAVSFDEPDGHFDVGTDGIVGRYCAT